MTTYLADPDGRMTKEEHSPRLERHVDNRRIRAAAWTVATLAFSFAVAGLIIGRLIT